MITIANILSAEWANALGWALLHSIWQSAVIFLVLIAALRIVPLIFSRIRYAIACGALVFFAVSVLVTFIFLSDTPAVTATIAATNLENVTTSQTDARPTELGSATRAVVEILNGNMPLILSLWILGFVFSSMRLSTGVYLLYRMRSAARPLEDSWSEYVKRQGSSLGIPRLVRLAESAAISSPVVIGYFKPMILVPAGMLTGLTTEQIETIFLHELAHIRRHDYLINLVQILIEALFFFNPFVRKISGIIRREREYCCDDLVVRHHGGARAYAHALERLANAGLAAPAFALPLTDSNNQLLDRIRRIMEKSAKNYAGRGRLLIPIVLLTALFCISWLGITQDRKQQKDRALNHQDTLKSKKHQGARYSRKSIITLDENGQPHEEVVVEFEGDEELRPLLEKHVPGPPDVSIHPNAPVNPPWPDIDLQALPDSLPIPAFPFDNGEEWGAFFRDFDELERSFEDMNAMRHHDLAKLLKELEGKFGLLEGSEPFHFGFPSDAFNDSRFFYDSTSSDLLEEQLGRFRGLDPTPFLELQSKLHFEESDLHRFEQEIRDHLVEDGYLSADEVIETLEWSDDAFKVNGKAVKESDRKKYQKLHQRYLDGSRKQE